MGDYKVISVEKEREIKEEVKAIIKQRLKKIIIYLPDRNTTISSQGIKELFVYAEADLNKE